MKLFRKRQKQATKRQRSQKGRTMFAISRINPVLKQRIIDKANEENLVVYAVAARLLEKGLLIEAYEAQIVEARQFVISKGLMNVDDTVALRIYRTHIKEKSVTKENKVASTQDKPQN